jgi:hypothetical protein
MRGREGIAHHLERISRERRVAECARSRVTAGNLQHEAQRTSLCNARWLGRWDSSNARSSSPSAASSPARDVWAPLAQRANGRHSAADVQPR